MTIYRLDTSLEDDRPMVAWDITNERDGAAWELACSILDGECPISDYEPVHFTVRSRKAGSYHCYMSPGTLPLISAMAVCVIGRENFQAYELLPAYINDTNFFLPFCREALDCLDREKSVIRLWKDSNDIREIEKYDFHDSLIGKHKVFTIPESLEIFFATQSVHDAVIEAKLRGIEFTRFRG